MGQKCCRPATRIDPKHIALLTQIYNDTHENIKELNYQTISAYLIKKGHIKTLCDYLSSHLNLINPSLIICRNRQLSMRVKKPQMQMFSCVITTEICKKIIDLCRQIKSKYSSKYENRQLSTQEDQQIQLQMRMSDYRKSSKKQIVKEHFADLRTSSKKKITGSRRVNTVANDGYFIEEQISQNMLQICSQVMRQTISSSNALAQPKSETRIQPNKVQITQFKIIQKIQNILGRMLDIQTSFVKMNDNIVKQILDSQITILLMCRKQNVQIPMATPSKIVRTSTSYAPVPTPLLSPLTPLRVDQIVKRPSFQIQENAARMSRSSNLPQFQQVSVFKIDDEEKLKMGKLSLQNYYKLTHKANINLSSANLYRDVVRVHMPKLLQYWADIMMSQKQKQQQNNEFQLSSIPQKQIQQSKQQNSASYLDQNRDNSKKNIELIQKIILEFFNNYFSYGQSQYVYSQLMTIFDRLYFSRTRISSIEKLIFESLKKYELRNSVISKWFDYLLDYLGIIMSFNSDASLTGNQSIQKRNNLSFNERFQQSNYFAQLNSELTFAISRSDYINWHRSQNVIGCIKTIKTWIESDQVDIDNILNYKRHKLFVVLLANLARGDFKVNKQIFKLVQFMIVNDVRCYGYLIDTIVFFIGKLQITKTDFSDEYNWEDFSKKWQNQKQILLKQSVDNGNSQYLGFKSKPSSLSLKIKSFKSYGDVPIQFINVQKFIDELIYIACYPFLSKVILTLPASDPTMSVNHARQSSQTKKSRKNSSIITGQVKDFAVESKVSNESQLNSKNQNIKLSNKDIRKSDSIKNLTSIKQIKEKQEKISPRIKRTDSYQVWEPDMITQKQNLKHSINKLFSRSVFQQIIGFLFKGIHLTNAKINDRYIVKLASVFLSANMQTIIILTSKCTRNRDTSYIFNLISRVNKFLVKTHKELKKISIQHQSNQNSMFGSRRVSDQHNQSDYQKMFTSRQYKEDEPQLFKEIPYEMKYKQDNQFSFKTFKDFATTRQVLKSFHKWIYPSIANILSQPYLNLEQVDMIKNENQYAQEQQIQDEENIKYNIRNTKLMLNITFKIYIKHLISLTRQTAERKLKQYSVDVQQYSQDDNQNSNRGSLRRHTSLIIKPSILNRIKGKRQLNQSNEGLDNEKLRLEQIPAIQLFQIYLFLIQKAKTRISSIVEQSPSNKHSKLMQPSLYQIRRRNTISQINVNSTQTKSRNPFKKLKQKNEKNVVVETNNQLEEKINIIFNKLKSHFNSVTQNDVSIQNNQVISGSGDLNDRLNMNPGEKTLKNINFQNSNKSSEYNLISEVYQIVAHQNLSQKMFKLVDNVSEYTYEGQSLENVQMNQKSNQKIKLSNTRKIIEGYLLKQDKGQSTMVDQPIENGRCFVFKKAKNKILNMFGNSNSNQQSGTTANEFQPNLIPRLTNQKSVSERVIGHNLQISQISKNNAHQTIPYIIYKLQQNYGSNTMLKTVVSPSGTGFDHKQHFSLTENDYNRKESVLNSSMIQSSIQSSSFGQVFSQIKKH